jgi:uroporphyrinogen-III synthase
MFRSTHKAASFGDAHGAGTRVAMSKERMDTARRPPPEDAPRSGESNHGSKTAGNDSRPLIALLEARMGSALARLVERHGGVPLSVPAVREAPVPATDAVDALLAALSQGRCEILVFTTGVAVSRLFELAERAGVRAELVTSLRSATTVCRGPKPSAALRGFGVTPTLNAREPFTTAELIDALSEVSVTGRRVLLLNYGERCETLFETLVARRAEVHEFWFYRWELPEDTTPIERLVRRIVDRDVDALALTCQIQFRHLHQVAQRIDLDSSLIRAMNEYVVVGAVGPTCRAILAAHGVEPHVVPEHPKMGPLIAALMRYLDTQRASRAYARSPVTH